MARQLAVIVLLLGLAGCATTGTTVVPGEGEHPAFRATKTEVIASLRRFMTQVRWRASPRQFENNPIEVEYESSAGVTSIFMIKLTGSSSVTVVRITAAPKTRIVTGGVKQQVMNILRHLATELETAQEYPWLVPLEAGERVRIPQP